ncbi:MAG: HD domain-containing protein [Phycisphaerales bacterium]|nr:MAG: HD domain-containing protein [Phycisphaerales bacterium]
MSRGLFAYVTIVTGAAVTLAAAVVVFYPVVLPDSKAWSGVVALTLLTLAGEAFGVRAGKAIFSISLIPTVSMVPLFGPAVAVVTTLVSRLFAHALILRTKFIKWLFNVGQFTLAIGLGSVVFVVLGGNHDYSEFELGELLLPLGGLIVTYFAVNVSLVSGAIALDTGKRFVDTFRGLAPVAFANDLASSSFALFLVFAFVKLSVSGLLIVLLPLFFLQHSYGLHRRLQKQNREILEFTIRTIEAKDPYTSGHSARVASLSRQLAEALSLSAQEVEDVETAALLHDIGKIDFAYSELIGSAGPLSEADREIIRSHPERGALLLTSLSNLSNSVLAGVRHHHEHFDGNGYPSGLTGEDIPLAARIIMVVDTVDAMLSNRPYRSALSVEEVAGELRRFSGRQFDPNVVKGFLQTGMLERAARRSEMDRTPLPLAGVRHGAEVAARHT